MSARKPVVILLGALSFLLPFLVYLQTMSPTLNFWDAGEFITTSYILGIPHPPATPMYVLVGRLASVLPLGIGVAHKINVMSAFFASLAAFMMFLLVLKATRAWNIREGTASWLAPVGAFVAVIFIAFSDTFWINAIEAEVYSLSAFLMGFTLWLILDWSEHAESPRGNALVYLILYLLSLAVGFHLGTILVFPGFFVLALLIRTKSFSDVELWLVGLALALFLGSTILHMPDSIMIIGLLLILAAGLYLILPNTRSDFGLLKPVAKELSAGAVDVHAPRARPFLLASLGLFVLGLSVHLFLLIRAGQSPAINEADPSSWGNLWAVLKREQYPFQLPTERKAALGWQFQHMFGYFWQQFRMPPERWLGDSLHLGRALTAIPIGLGLLGVWYQRLRERRHWWTLITILLINTIGLVFFLNFSSEEVRERDYFYANGFYFFAIFIGLGAVGLLESLRSERGGRMMAAIVAPLLILASFGPLKQHWFTHNRSENLIARDYAYNVLAPLAENSVIFTNGDNDTFPLWYIQEVEGFRKDVRVVNLSLLNTDWYMAQLRDYEPKLPITWTDEQLAEVATHYFRMEDGRILQPRDEIINHLFVNTQRLPAGWDSRTYYFAVTIPRETLLPFQPYLMMEGMVYRMTLSEGSDQVDLALLRKNLEHVFEWRGILSQDRTSVAYPWSEAPIDSGPSILDQVPQPDDPALDLPAFHKDETIRHLIQNYAAAWSRLAIEAERPRADAERNVELAVRSMEMAQLIREDLAPVVLYMGYLYMMNGEPERAVETYERYLKGEPGNFQLWARYAQALESMGEYRKVVEALGKVIQLNPDYEPAYMSLVDFIVSYFPSTKNILAVKQQLEEFLARHPDSQPIRERLQQLEEALGAGMAPPEAGNGQAPPAEEVAP